MYTPLDCVSANEPSPAFSVFLFFFLLSIEILFLKQLSGGMCSVGDSKLNGKF